MPGSSSRKSASHTSREPLPQRFPPPLLLPLSPSSVSCFQKVPPPQESHLHSMPECRQAGYMKKVRHVTAYMAYAWHVTGMEGQEEKGQVGKHANVMSYKAKKYNKCSYIQQKCHKQAHHGLAWDSTLGQAYIPKGREGIGLPVQRVMPCCLAGRKGMVGWWW